MTYRQELVNKLITQIEHEIEMDYSSMSHSKSEMLMQIARGFRSDFNREYEKDESK